MSDDAIVELLVRLDERLQQLGATISDLKDAIESRVTLDQHSSLVARTEALERRLSVVEKMVWTATGSIVLIQWVAPLAARFWR